MAARNADVGATHHPLIPDGHAGLVTRLSSNFDRFAESWTDHVSRPAFFVACLLLVLVWGPSYFLIGNFDAWQLVINTATTIVTFLLVALLQNSGR